MIRADIDLWEAVKLLTTDDAKDFKDIEISKDMISEAYLVKNDLGYSVHIRLIHCDIQDASIVYEKIENISKEDFKNQLFRVIN